MFDFSPMAIAFFDSFSSLETLSLIILPNIYSNKLFWEYVFDECFSTVPVLYNCYGHITAFSGLAMFNQNYFSAIQKKVQKQHFSQKILQYKHGIKKRWTVMKEINGKAKDSKNQTFPGNLKLVTK